MHANNHKHFIYIYIFVFGGEKRKRACVAADLKSSVLASDKGETAFVFMSGPEKKKGRKTKRSPRAEPLRSPW